MAQLGDPIARPAQPIPYSVAPQAMIPYGVTSANPGIAAASGGYVDMNVRADQPVYFGDPWSWQLLPDGLMYKSYLAGGREPRLGSQWVHERTHGWLWDAMLGGRVGVLRYGTEDNIFPEGWQLDFEGAVFPRMDLDRDHDRDLISADFRVGVPLTARRGPWEGKFAYYHLSSHLADEFMLAHDRPRINYVRDALVLGLALRPVDDVRLYAEADWAFKNRGGNKPWQFQFGADLSPEYPTGIQGAPFFAVNGRIRQDVDFGGNLTIQTGWQWRGQTDRLARVGMQYFNGKSDQGQFFDDFEEQIGVGLWYDY